MDDSKRRRAIKLFSKDIHNTLLENGKKQQKLRGTVDEIDFHPVVKLFAPHAKFIWLLTELETEDPDIAFGLCDFGMDYPDLRNVRISELELLRDSHGLAVMVDANFRTRFPLSVYARAAQNAGDIITDNIALLNAARAT